MKIIATTAEGSAYPYPRQGISTFAGLVRHVQEKARRDVRMTAVVDEPTRTVTLRKGEKVLHHYRLINN
jgi:hypothetical protein